MRPYSRSPERSGEVWRAPSAKTDAARWCYGERMRGSEIVELMPLLGAAGVQLLVMLALDAWGRWVARRHGGRWWRFARWLPLLGFVVGLLGIGATVVLLLQAFGALSGTTAADRASELSDGIARAMMATAVTAPLSSLLFLVGLISLTVGTVRRPRADGEARAATAVDAAVTSEPAAPGRSDPQA